MLGTYKITADGQPIDSLGDLLDFAVSAGFSEERVNKKYACFKCGGLSCFQAYEAVLTWLLGQPEIGVRGGTHIKFRSKR
jgi:hypothetical protein